MFAKTIYFINMWPNCTPFLLANVCFPQHELVVKHITSKLGYRETISEYMGLIARKLLCCMQTTKVQTSLHIRAV